MKRSLAAAAVLALTVLAAGCDDEGDADTQPSAGASSEASAESPGAGEVENETYPRGAEVSRFCAVAQEIDDAMDAAKPGNSDDWNRILSSFEALDALGVPDDLPEKAVTQLVQLEITVQQSTSVRELEAAEQPPTDAIGDYVDDHCG